MKKKERRNGFTLIELLAVIIILAVIALIATPIVINVVENAQKKAFERSAQGYYDAARYVHNDMMLREDEQDIMFMFENGQQRSNNKKYTLKVQGEVPNKGLVYLSKSGEVAVSIANDKWCAKTNGSGTVELTDDPNDCGYAPEECFTFSDFTLTDDQKTLFNNQNLGFEGMDGTLLQVDSFDKENPACKGLVIIPSEHNGRKVEGIKAAVDLGNSTLSPGVFQENTNITGVILPKEMKIIGTSAFYSTSNLKQVILNEELRYIGDGSFAAIPLGEITIPDKVVYIGAMAFYMSELTNIKLSNNLSVISDLAFSSNKLTSLDIPNSVTTLGYGVFSDNQISDLKIGKIVETRDFLNDNPFENNPLTDVTIKEGVTSVCSLALAQKGIINLSLPNTLTNIEAFAFYENELTSITIPSNVITIGEMAFTLNSFPNAEAITILGDATRFDSTWESIGFPSK